MSHHALRSRLALAAALVLGACEGERSIVIDGIPEGLDATLSHRGAEVATHRVRRALTARLEDVDADALTLSTPGPCGAIEVPIQRAAGSYGDRIELAVGQLPPLRRVLVDGRNAPRARIEIGSLSLEVRPGVTGPRTFAWTDACDGARVVRVDGAQVAELPEGDADLLIDVAGTHCYRLDEEDRESIVLLTLDTTAPRRTLETIGPARAHVLPLRVDFPFAAVPDRVDLDALGRYDETAGHVAITSLVPADCGATAEHEDIDARGEHAP